ncbi:uncharacterized protein Z518_07789 [Rhinocladiella mackenziei CBS 650.93]|uniref:Uncharacterized protein n=1 Tax=Rhinocladiella mackenziei CBS 650.93 TaxID=1442369 RepID=A0A0D2J5D7_9EURO|nr:uncharacterized protein Z518_07789 [Rhinocladiella mackenziei CBS 650.93]KIX04235.1 hypothetical protein Z518_07789 [Rhinocladiella mackenziei CBS 650.93]
MPSSSKSTKPKNWRPEHDDFIRQHARNGEDAMSILILFETEFPNVMLTHEWIAERVKGCECR